MIRFTSISVSKLVLLLLFLLLLVLLLVLQGTLISSNALANANPPSGAVVKYNGEVMLFQQDSDNPSQLRDERHLLFKNNRLESKQDAKAFVKLRDGSKLLMQDKSSVHIVDGRQIRVLDGKVMFAVAKRKPQQEPFQVATRLAKLGIRGTRFLIEGGENGNQVNVYLKDGDITVYPAEKHFKLYKEDEKKAFADYVANGKNEFEQYKKQHQKAFLEYVKEYEMKPNKGIAINGTNLRELEIPPEIEALFAELDDPAFNIESF